MAPLRPAERAEARASLGFDPELPIGLVLFGGQGAAEMLDIARSLPDRQLGVDLRPQPEAGVAAGGATAPRRRFFIEGFTQEVARYMQLADYFIGKAGAGQHQRGRWPCGCR